MALTLLHFDLDAALLAYATVAVTGAMRQVEQPGEAKMHKCILA
jgi:hypothetical protein